MKKLVFIATCLYEPNVNTVTRMLSERGIDWFRLNTETFPLISTIDFYCTQQDGAYACIKLAGQQLDTRRVTSVWNRRFGEFLLAEGLQEHERAFVRSECVSLVGGFYDCIRCAWINPRISEIQANNKLYQLGLAQDIGLNVPKTIVSNNPSEVRKFIDDCPGPILFKPVAGVATVQSTQFTREIQEAYSGQIRLPPEQGNQNIPVPTGVYSRLLTSKHLKMIENISGCPVVFQEYVEKQVELRITIVADDIFSAEIHSQEYEETKVDFRHLAYMGDRMPTHKIHKLPDDLQAKLMSLMASLGLVFGCFDMILTPAGEYVFLEVNPSGQWGWIESLTGMPITEALTNLLVTDGR